MELSLGVMDADEDGRRCFLVADEVALDVPAYVLERWFEDMADDLVVKVMWTLFIVAALAPSQQGDDILRSNVTRLEEVLPLACCPFIELDAAILECRNDSTSGCSQTDSPHAQLYVYGRTSVKARIMMSTLGGRCVREMQAHGCVGVWPLSAAASAEKALPLDAPPTPVPEEVSQLLFPGELLSTPQQPRPEPARTPGSQSETSEQPPPA